MEAAIEPAVLSPDRVSRQMAELWANLGKQAEGGVLRACALTLIVLTEESDDAQALAETLAQLMHDHPSRAIVVRVRDCAERVLEARVVAQCWMPFGKREQICCEQVEITASEGALPDLTPVLAPLSAPDLPIVVWHRSPRLFERSDFDDLAADKIIVDSAGFADPVAAIRALAAQRRPIADLAWTRLTRWRELIAQIFENRQYLGCLEEITSARVVYAGAHPSPDAYYLAAWLACGLEQAGSRAIVTLAPGAGTAVELAVTGAEARYFSVRHTEAGTAEIRLDGLVNRTVFEPPSDYTLLREELGITGPDTVYQRALARAAATA